MPDSTVGDHDEVFYDFVPDSLGRIVSPGRIPVSWSNSDAINNCFQISHALVPGFL